MKIPSIVEPRYFHGLPQKYSLENNLEARKIFLGPPPKEVLYLGIAKFVVKRQTVFAEV